MSPKVEGDVHEEQGCQGHSCYWHTGYQGIFKKQCRHDYDIMLQVFPIVITIIFIYLALT